MSLPEAKNELFWDNLLQLIAERRIVPVVGPDLLTVQPPAGPRAHFHAILAGRLAARLGVNAGNLPAGVELNAVASRHLEHGGDMEDVYLNVRAVTPGRGLFDPPDALLKLASIGAFRLFVTTTFDELLVTALDRARFGGKARTRVFSYARDATGDLPAEWAGDPTPAVFHLFGRVSSLPEYAVTEEDTLEFVHALQSEKTRARNLVNELCRSSLLILGCSFPDWLARFFIRLVRTERLLLASGKTDFVVDRRVAAEPDLRRFLERFSRRTRIVATDGADFIDELHRRWLEKNPVGASTGGQGVTRDDDAIDIEPGAVFLSYASEDLEAARRIRDSLGREGIVVFFDKEFLEAGDDYSLKIARYISRSSVFVPVVSSATLTEKRRYFRIEWNAAFDEDKRKSWAEHFILPVAIDGTKASEDALPPRFGELQWTCAPEGVCPDEFISKVKALYRRYQKAFVSEV